MSRETRSEGGGGYSTSPLDVDDPETARSMLANEHIRVTYAEYCHLKDVAERDEHNVRPPRSSVEGGSR